MGAGKKTKKQKAETKKAETKKAEAKRPEASKKADRYNETAVFDMLSVRVAQLKELFAERVKGDAERKKKLEKILAALQKQSEKVEKLAKKPRRTKEAKST